MPLRNIEEPAIAIRLRTTYNGTLRDPARYAVRSRPVWMEQMNLATLLAAIAIIALGALQYMLMANGIRDLIRRPRVRGGNKVLWGLGIICLPFAGALIYGWMGPTSFLARPRSEHVAPQPSSDVARNVTPIGHARSVRSARTEQPVTQPPTRIRKTGS